VRITNAQLDLGTRVAAGPAKADHVESLGRRKRTRDDRPAGLPGRDA
jgi:hypothetical protein